MELGVLEVYWCTGDAGIIVPPFSSWNLEHSAETKAAVDGAS